ncbi:hypothetical protein HG531_006213 [Fusarium graminearum]|nr:hypothetical protein HG531_006213 [Fusarium graminearum]
MRKQQILTGLSITIDVLLELLSVVHVLPHLGGAVLIDSNKVSLTIVIDICKAYHIAFDRLPVWVNITDALPVIRSAPIDPGTHSAIVIGKYIISDTVAVEIGQDHLFAGGIGGCATNATNGLPGPEAFKQGALLLPDLAHDLFLGSSSSSANAKTNTWKASRVYLRRSFQPATLVSFKDSLQPCVGHLLIAAIIWMFLIPKIICSNVDWNFEDMFPGILPLLDHGNNLRVKAISVLLHSRLVGPDNWSNKNSGIRAILEETIND